MATAAEASGSLRSEASPVSTNEDSEKRKVVHNTDASAQKTTGFSGSDSGNDLRHRLGHNTTETDSTVIPQHGAPLTPNQLPQRPAVPVQPQRPRQPETQPTLVISQNHFASAVLTIISILLAIAAGFLFIQFRTEYKLSQLSKLSPSPSPFMKLKNSLHGAPSQPPKRPNTRFQKERLPEPEPDPIDLPDPDRYRATKETKDKYPFLKEDPKVIEQNRGVDPEYEAYAQQLQQVLGNLKQAVKKIDPSANITEIAGLVKMRPNNRDEEKGIRIEDDHKKFLEDDEDEVNTVVGNSGKIPESSLRDKLNEKISSFMEEHQMLSEEEKWLLEKDNTVAQDPSTMSEEEAELQFQRIAEYIERRREETTNKLLEDFISKQEKSTKEKEQQNDLTEEEKYLSLSSKEEMYSRHPELKAKVEAAEQLLKMTEYIEKLQDDDSEKLKPLQKGKTETAAPNQDQEESNNNPNEPVSNPYDDIVAYKNDNGLRDRKLALELEDALLDGEGIREPATIIKELTEAKKERFKLINQLVNYYFETLGPEEREEMREQYADIISDTEGKANFQNRLHETIFGSLEGDELSGYDDDADDEDETEAVFDERLGGDISTDAKELLDSIPESERDWIYKRLKAERKMEQDIKDKIINEMVADREKTKDEGDRETQKKVEST